MATNPFLIETASFTVLPAEDPRLEIHELEPSGHRALFAKTRFRAGETIRKFGAAETLDRPNRYTLQVADEGRHIVLDPEFLLYVNHHCRPNTFFDLRTMELKAIRPIREGDELTFFYPSTEWMMEEAFDCHCGWKGCHGRIAGAAFLDEEKLAGYDLSEHIQDLVVLRELNRR